MPRSCLIPAILVSGWLFLAPLAASPLKLSPSDQHYLRSTYNPTMTRTILEGEEKLFEVNLPYSERIFRRALPSAAAVLAYACHETLGYERNLYMKSKTPEYINRHRNNFQKAELGRNVLLGVFSALVNVRF